ncbi:TPA: Hha/YmoA family nucleoid-associated regulatory protein [Escherichia coli]
MEVKTKEDWLYQFRRCSSRETLEKVISHTRYKLTPAELEAFNSAVDHRLAELTMNKPAAWCCFPHRSAGAP